jgi:hypothetical protein
MEGTNPLQRGLRFRSPIKSDQNVNMEVRRRDVRAFRQNPSNVRKDYITQKDNLEELDSGNADPTPRHSWVRNDATSIQGSRWCMCCRFQRPWSGAATREFVFSMQGSKQVDLLPSSRSEEIFPTWADGVKRSSQHY